MNTTKLLYFDLEGSTMTGPHPELGQDLQRLKQARGITQARLAKIAGVSRRHVALALQGGNITVTILKKIMAALQTESIDLGPVVTASGSIAGMNPGVLLSAAQQIEQGVTVIAAAAASLRTYAHPPATTGPALDPHAAALIDQFISRVQLSDTRELAALQRAIDDSARTEDSALAPPRRRDSRSPRKRTTTA
jgi:transcriptional regulator with XRE-family HTH domain